MHIFIRQGIEEDLPEVYRLIKEFAHFQKTPGKLINTLEQMQKEKSFFHWFVAAEGQKVVGFATYFFAYYSWTGKCLYLDDLYVSEAYRGKGIGKQLLEAVINLAKQEECKKLRWQVSNWNKQAIRFYETMGASIDEVEINCDLDLVKTH